MEALIFPLSFKPESIDATPPAERPEGAGNFQQILQHKSMVPRDQAGKPADGHVNRAGSESNGPDGSRNIRPVPRKKEEPPDQFPVLQPMPVDESSPGSLEISRLFPDTIEAGFKGGAEFSLPQEPNPLYLEMLSAGADPEALPASQPMEAKEALPDGKILSFSHPSIPARPTGVLAGQELSAGFMKEEGSSQNLQNAEQAVRSRPDGLTAWMEASASSGPRDLRKIEKVRSQAPQGAAQIGKNLLEGSEGKTFFTSDFPAAGTAGLAESVADLKLNWVHPLFASRNKEAEEAPLAEKIFKKGPNPPAGSLNPAEQAFAGQEQKPADFLPEIRFPSGQQEWIHREGGLFHSESMEGGKAEMGNPKIFLGAIEGSAASLHGLGNRIEGAQGLPPTLVRPEIVNLPEQVVQRIIWSIRNQEERIKLTLDPPDLGHLYIEINRSKENIHATLWADNVAAKTALETGQHQIQRIMENEGFKLTKFDVFVQQDPGWFQGQGKRENHFGPDPRTPIFSFEQNGEVPEKSPLDPIEIRRKTWGKNSLDLLV
jgi:hypothetical protein